MFPVGAIFDRPAVAGIAFLLGLGEYVTALMRAINDRPYMHILT